MTLSSYDTSLSSRLFTQAFDEHLQVAQESQERLKEDFDTLVHIVLTSLQNGKKILFCGNGGSAADSQHLATELTVKFKKPRRALPALALTTDTSALTAIGNDFGFEDIFSRQIEALGDEGDTLIAISTSGTSPNIIKALKMAKDRGLRTIALTGGTGGVMKEWADLSLIVPSKTTARIQEIHIFLGQTLIEAVEDAYGWR
jgi:D-sedoheptulose 7-phosphate isomerase